VKILDRPAAVIPRIPEESCHWLTPGRLSGKGKVRRPAKTTYSFVVFGKQNIKTASF